MKITEAINELTDAGTEFGQQYSNFAQDVNIIANDIEVAAKSKIKELEVRDSSSGCLLHTLNIILFISGLVFFFLSLIDQSFWSAWFWISCSWVIGLLVALSRGGKNIEWSEDETLFDAFFDSATAIIENKRKSQSRIEVETPERIRGPKPFPQPFGVSHEGAEALCVEWMKYLGELDAEFTRVVGDGGIDVHSSRFIGQVKNYAGAVGVASVRELAGVSSVDGREAIFFTSGTYASGAITFANQFGIALFIYDAVEGTLFGANDLATCAIENGL